MSGQTKMTLERGGLYLSASDYQRYFQGLDSVILLRRDLDLLIMPVRHAAAGGYLLKMRNVAGDRVVSAGDFFRGQGVSDERTRPLSGKWSEDDCALIVEELFDV
jgi:hypothetical protein